ncbi:hypothetical protein R1sor_027023 [Riccia sorocarpa]|uniref:Protein kinase domain-containing protein n=1 Tax=Riccia sorocarpa TaxID=122646 RepID=A0ABD3GG73_9MARC
MADCGCASLKLTDSVGTPGYIAPELHSCSYGREMDVWSIGVICFQLVTGNFPFTEDGGHEAELSFSETPFVSTEAKTFIRQLLKEDPRSRMSAAQALGTIAECDQNSTRFKSR